MYDSRYNIDVYIPGRMGNFRLFTLLSIAYYVIKQTCSEYVNIGETKCVLMLTNSFLFLSW